MDTVNLKDNRLTPAIQEILTQLVAQRYCKEVIVSGDRRDYEWCKDRPTWEFRQVVKASTKTPVEYASGLYAALM